MEQISTKNKSVVQLVFMMSMPSVLSMLVNSMYNIVDGFFVARISENAMAALSLIFPIQNLIISIGVGFGVGINAMIALNLGAKNQKAANHAASYGLILSILHGLMLSALCILVMPWFLGLFTNNQEVISMGLEYANVVFIFATAVTVGIALEKIFQAVGRMKTSMFVLSAGCITNIILDPIFIFGLGPVPSMGIKGAAVATAIGQIVTLALYLIIIYKKPLPIKISTKALKEQGSIQKLYHIGVPATLNMALPSLLISALNGILSIYSPIYVVILGIYYKLQTFVYLPANGIIQGIRPLISYNYGAGEYTKVQKIYQTALGFSLAIMTVGTVICLFLPNPLMRLFTTNQETIAQGVIALRLISLGFMVSAVSITTCGALEALGRGVSSLAISLLRYIVIIIPLAYFLSEMIGVRGVWGAFAITECVACGLSFVLYKKYIVRNMEDSYSMEEEKRLPA